MYGAHAGVYRKKLALNVNLAKLVHFKEWREAREESDVRCHDIA